MSVTVSGWRGHPCCRLRRHFRGGERQATQKGSNDAKVLADGCSWRCIPVRCIPVRECGACRRRDGHEVNAAAVVGGGKSRKPPVLVARWRTALHPARCARVRLLLRAPAARSVPDRFDGLVARDGFGRARRTRPGPVSRQTRQDAPLSGGASFLFHFGAVERRLAGKKAKAVNHTTAFA